jgi:hypothetical protein
MKPSKDGGNFSVRISTVSPEKSVCNLVNRIVEYTHAVFKLL